MTELDHRPTTAASPGVRTHHVLAMITAVPLVVLIMVDWVITGVTGRRTWITDDELASPAAAVIMSLALAVAFAAILTVLRGERELLDAAGRTARWGRRILQVGAVGMIVGNGVVHPILLITATRTGLGYELSGLLALVALGCCFLPALLLGLTQLRRNRLGLGGRLLSLGLPALAVTALLALTAPGWASPVLLTAVVLLGLSTLGIRRRWPGSGLTPYRGETRSAALARR